MKIAIAGLLFLTLIPIGLLNENINFWNKMDEYRQSFIQYLLSKVADPKDAEPEDGFDLVYILGGNQASLSLKFQTTHRLCARKRCDRILMLSRPGITEYSKTLKRNLTNDEWAIDRMSRIGLPAEKIEFIPMEDHFFGTYNEAKNISRIVRKDACRSIALISSAYHTKRVRVSFEKFLKHQPVKIHIYGSTEKGSATDLLVELVKLKIYQLL